MEQRKKRGFYKYHNFLGHKISQCVICRDLIQNVLKDGRLKFGDTSKQPMKIDVDPLQVEDSNSVEPVNTMMVKITGNAL